MNLIKQLVRFFLYSAVNCVFSLAPLVPKALIPSLATCLFFIAKPFLKKDYRNFEKNLTGVLKIPEEEWREFADACMKHQIICGLETLKFLHHPDLLKIDGLEEAKTLIQNLSRKGRGMIAITAHCGSWEMCGSLIARFSPKPTYVLAKPAKKKFISNALQRLREKEDNLTVVWNDDPKLLRRLITALKQQATLGIVMDQRPNSSGDPDVQFFGQPTKFVSGPAKLTLQNEASLMSIFCLRLGPFHYRCETREIALPSLKTMDSHKLSQILAKEMEDTIRKYPQQWTWNYRRWGQLSGDT